MNRNLLYWVDAYISAGHLRGSCEWRILVIALKFENIADPFVKTVHANIFNYVFTLLGLA